MSWVGSVCNPLANFFKLFKTDVSNPNCKNKKKNRVVERALKQIKSCEVLGVGMSTNNINKLRRNPLRQHYGCCGTVDMNCLNPSRASGWFQKMSDTSEYTWSIVHPVRWYFSRAEMNLSYIDISDFATN